MCCPSLSWTTKRFGSTGSLFRKPVWKTWCYRTAVIRFGQPNGSMAHNFLKGNLPEKLVPLAALIVGKRSGSITLIFLKETLRKIWCCRTAPCCLRAWKMQPRHTATASERNHNVPLFPRQPTKLREFIKGNKRICATARGKNKGNFNDGLGETVREIWTIYGKLEEF